MPHPNLEPRHRTEFSYQPGETEVVAGRSGITSEFLMLFPPNTLYVFYTYMHGVVSVISGVAVLLEAQEP